MTKKQGEIWKRGEMHHCLRGDGRPCPYACATTVFLRYRVSAILTTRPAILISRFDMTRVRRCTGSGQTDSLSCATKAS